MWNENITYKKIKRLKSKKSKQVIALRISIVVLLLLLGVIYFTTDLFKSPKTLFYKYLIVSNLNQISTQSYDDFVEELYEHDTYDITAYIQHSIKDTTIEDTSTIDLANGITTNLEIKVDEHDTYLHLKAAYENEELFNFEAIDNDSMVGAKGKNLQDKYMVVDLGKLSETLEKLGLDSTGIGDIEQFHRCEFLDISKENRETILKTYMKYIDDVIPKSNYSVEKNVEIDVNDKTYKCNAYTLKLTDEQIQAIYLGMLNELREDDLTLGLIVEKYNMVNLYKTDITKEMIVADIDRIISEADSKVPGTGRIEITVYENNSRTIRTEINKITDEETDSVCIDVTKLKDGATVFIKNNIDNTETDLLIARQQIDEYKNQYKFVYTKNAKEIQFNVTSEVHKGVDVNIPHFSKENSINLTEADEENIDKVKKEFEKLYNNGKNKFEEIGLPKGLMKELISQ